MIKHGLDRRCPTSMTISSCTSVIGPRLLTMTLACSCNHIVITLSQTDTLHLCGRWEECRRRQEDHVSSTLVNTPPAISLGESTLYLIIYIDNNVASSSRRTRDCQTWTTLTLSTRRVFRPPFVTAHQRQATSLHNLLPQRRGRRLCCLGMPNTSHLTRHLMLHGLRRCLPEITQ